MMRPRERVVVSERVGYCLLVRAVAVSELKSTGHRDLWQRGDRVRVDTIDPYGLNAGRVSKNAGPRRPVITNSRLVNGRRIDRPRMAHRGIPVLEVLEQREARYRGAAGKRNDLRHVGAKHAHTQFLF